SQSTVDLVQDDLPPQARLQGRKPRSGGSVNQSVRSYGGDPRGVPAEFHDQPVRGNHLSAAHSEQDAHDGKYGRGNPSAKGLRSPTRPPDPLPLLGGPLLIVHGPHLQRRST